MLPLSFTRPGLEAFSLQPCVSQVRTLDRPASPHMAGRALGEHGHERLTFAMASSPHAGEGDDRGGGGGRGNNTSILTRTKTRTKRPAMYRVLLLNDDYTPMEFVIHILERFFNKDRDAATRIMLHVHQNGVGECGVFTYEVAETKVTQVMDFSRKHQHPLQCVMEKN